jgi:dihydroorotate dehydrogenase
MLFAGVSAYAAALGIHLTVGYTSLMHLLPAFAGLVVFLLGLGLSFSYLCRDEGKSLANRREK